MKDYLIKKKKLEFIKTVIRWQNLPKVWKAKFDTGEDMRLWFDSISKLEKFKDFTEEVKNILKNYNVKILTDDEKKIEFLNTIKKIQRIPERGSLYFSDNSDMYSWYMNYKSTHSNYESKIIKYLKEYQDFDLEPIWHIIKHEFITIIKKLKRVPEYGEAIISDYNIDVRVIYEKIKTYDKPLYEKVLLHLETYKGKSMSIEDRTKELEIKIQELGYIPELGESRFTDGTDMFTWYTKYKNNFPQIGNNIDSLIKEEQPKQNKKVNIYMIPNFENTESFYDIYINVGERLDITDVVSFETLKEKDTTIEKRGSFSLKPNEEISFIDIKKGIMK